MLITGTIGVDLEFVQDGYEPQKARCHGRLGFPRTRRDIPIEAIRGERRRRLMRRSKLKTRNAVLQPLFRL